MRRILQRIKLLPVDIYINCAILMFSIFLYSLASRYPKMARIFPQLVLALVIILTSLDIFAKTLRGNQDSVKEKDYQEMKEPLRQKIDFLLTSISVFFFLLSMLLFGFTVGTFVFLFLFAWSLGYKNLKRLVFSCILITGFLYVIFILIMKSFLPEGFLFEFLWG